MVHIFTFPPTYTGYINYTPKVVNKFDFEISLEISTLVLSLIQKSGLKLMFVCVLSIWTKE